MKVDVFLFGLKTVFIDPVFVISVHSAEGLSYSTKLTD